MNGKIKAMMKSLIAFILSLTLASPAFAGDEEISDEGTLNPDEMSLSNSLARAARGDVNMVICSQGYVLTKKGDHKDARALFEACAAKGWTASMTWMAYMEQNGFGADEEAAQSAEWDRRAAEKGDPIGQFNYGLNLLRGYGVEQDLIAGQDLINQAADAGVEAAQQLKDADYDPRAVTPDADEWKFEKRLY